MPVTSTTPARRVIGIPAEDAPWLIYLGFLVVQPLFDPTRGPLAWLWVGAMIAVFLPLYGWTHRVMQARGWLWRHGMPGGVLGIVGMAALALFGSLLNPGAGTFAVYATAAAGKLNPRRRALITMAAVMLTLVAAFLLSPVPLQYRLLSFAPALVISPIIGVSILFDRERRHANARLKMAQGEVEQLATIAERERIARDLHDLLGHSLSTITLKAELAASLLTTDPQRAQAEISDVEKLSRQTLAQVRGAVRGYRATGLAGEVANAKLALEAAGIHFDYFMAPLPLRPAAESVLALALREAITNVVRHAGATSCNVTLQADGAYVLLSVQDDGSGLQSGLGSAGSGLSAMRERARGLGGYINLQPHGAAGSSGARLDVAIPQATALQSVGSP